MKILVPFDGSGLSSLAVDKAVEITKNNGAQLYIITVISSTIQETFLCFKRIFFITEFNEYF